MTKALVELLKSLFTADELQRFAAFLPYGNLTSALPSAPASLDAIAFEMVQALERRARSTASSLLDSKRNGQGEGPRSLGSGR